MKDNILVVVLVMALIIMAGVSLVFGLGNMVAMAIAPLTTQVAELKVTEQQIQRKLESSPAAMADDGQIMLLNRRISMLEARLNNNPPIPSVVQGRPAPNPVQPSEDFNKFYPIDIGTSPVLGNRNAPVTIVEFADLQCPFCARFHPVLRQVLAAYPDKVKIVLKNYPLVFHPNARPAAKLALAANLQGKYYEMVDLLLGNGGSVDDASIHNYARTLHLNYNKLMADYKNRDAEWEKILTNDTALGVQVSVMGTPTYFLNGRKTMARDLASYKTAIDNILSGKT